MGVKIFFKLGVVLSGKSVFFVFFFIFLLIWLVDPVVSCGNVFLSSFFFLLLFSFYIEIIYIIYNNKNKYIIIKGLGNQGVS